MTGHLGAHVREERRLAMLFCDVVGSTELSRRLEPEAYWELMDSFRAVARRIVEQRFEGHIVHIKGDGMFSIFGYPVAHENDSERAVRAGLALVRAAHETAPPAGASGERLQVRVGIHAGPVLLELRDVDVHGWAANVASRYETTADPGTVVISEELRERVGDRFELAPCPPRRAKGVDEPLRPLRVLGERHAPAQRSWAAPLVERDAELDRLRALWARVSAGDGPAAVLVHGEAGLGKSRLVDAVASEALAHGAAAVQLNGSDVRADAGLHPVRAFAEARCGIRDDTAEPERLARLADDVAGLGLDAQDAVPLLAPVLGIAPAAGYVETAVAPERLQELVTVAVRDYVVACLGSAPGVIVAEDLHWFDPASLALVRTLARQRTAGALVLATARDPCSGPWETMALRPLTTAARLTLVDALHAGLSDAERLALADRSGGVPLFIEELVRSGPAATSAVPGALYERLVAWLYATPAAVPVAATAAAAGRQVDRALLAATLERTPLDVEATLHALVEARVLEQSGDGDAPRYRFRHELLREVAYGLPPVSVRRRTHSRLSDVLAGREPRDWHALAHHLERAERWAEAAEACRHTSAGARRRGALDEAREQLSRALALLGRLERDAARDRREVGLRLRRAFLVMSQEGAGADGVAEDYDRCLEIATTDPDGDDAFSTLISIWAYDLSRAELDRARHVSETLRASLGDERSYFRPENRAGFGILDWFAGRFEPALDTLAGAVDELAVVGVREEVAAAWFVPNDPVVAMYLHLALARFMALDTPAAVAELERAQAAAVALDFPQGPWSAAYAAWLGSWMWAEAGRPERARSAVEELEALCERHGFESWNVITATHAVALDGLDALADDTAPGELLELGEALDSLVATWEEMHLRVFLPFYLTTVGALWSAAGDADRGREALGRSLELARATGMRFYDAETQRRLAALEASPEARAAALEEALATARAQAALPFAERIQRDLAAVHGADRERAAR